MQTGVTKSITVRKCGILTSSFLNCNASIASMSLSFTSQNGIRFSGTKVHVQLSIAFSLVSFTDLEAREEVPCS